MLTVANRQLPRAIHKITNLRSTQAAYVQQRVSTLYPLSPLHRRSLMSFQPIPMADIPVVTPAASTAAPIADEDMEQVFSCTIFGLQGWDSIVKIEKRLRDHDIPFKDVFKKRGTRENTGVIYFNTEDEMKQSMEKMAGIREAPSATTPAAAAASSTDDADSEVAKLTPTVFKVRTPMTKTRKRRIIKNTENTKKEFRAAKRTKIELNEGEVGYAEALEEYRSASEGEGEGEEEAAKSRSGGDARVFRASSGRTSPTLQVERTINDVVAPLWRKPYADQLILKRNAVKDLMITATRAWKREHGNTLTFPKESTEINEKTKAPNPVFCKLEEIVPSPVTLAYRNKCEFSIGTNSNNEVSIGHLMGKFTEGTVTVESIQDVPHVPGIAKSLSNTLLDFIQTFPEVGSSKSEDYKPYDKRDHSGFWRLFLVRNSAETKQVMCSVQVAAKDKSQEEMDRFRSALKTYFEQHVIQNPEWSAKNDGYTLRALQMQIYDGVSNAAPEGTPIELLCGEDPSIKERLMGLEFRVSQAAFFQINIPQTNRLYSIAAEFASLPPADAPDSVKAKSTLFDVCCGTGTIGLSLANRVGKVVGLEMSAAAVEDAKFNAKANGITNAYYYVGKAEDTISVALKDHVGQTQNLTPAQLAAQSDHIVTAIVDPPRSGLHSDVIRLLRKCPRIDRIVYVSCNPKSLMENLQKFIQPPSKKWSGLPFVALKAVPVDMFPMTDHCEMVVLLERTRPQPVFNKYQTPTKQFAHQMQPNNATTPAPAPATTATDATPDANKVEDTKANVEAADAATSAAAASAP